MYIYIYTAQITGPGFDSLFDKDILDEFRTFCSNLNMERTVNIVIGIAGWSYSDWQGIVYPRSGMDQLTYVSQFVDMIEINSTFYQPPSVKNSQSWLRRTQARPDFFFTAKLNQRFTHERLYDQIHVKNFKEGLAPLTEAEKLDTLLMQFRYDFQATSDNKEYLKKLVDSFKDTFTLVLEVRDHSWQLEENVEFIKSLGCALCSLDYPTGPTSFNLDCVTHSSGYMRLHGRNAEKWFSKSTRDESYNYYYSKEELNDIKKRIEILADHCKTYITVANNHYRGAQLANALELKNLLTGLKVEIPESLLQAYPHLSQIAKNPNLFL